MKQLTKEQRNKIYKIAYRKMKGNYTCGCEALFSSLFPSEKGYIGYIYVRMHFYFPEYYLFKRGNISYKNRWFEGKDEVKQREIAFLLCIEMTN